MGKVIIDALTRIQGHLRIDTRVEEGRVVETWSKGGDAQMAEMIAAMDEINRSSQSISKIIKVIDEMT